MSEAETSRAVISTIRIQVLAPRWRPEDLAKELEQALSHLELDDGPFLTFELIELCREPAVPIHASRRRVLTLKLARKAAQRLYDLTDPRLS